ncbi:MAG: exodeoxyribonuclease V subunit gamma [Alphaproteobacteria bacterium]|nr:exodeoxyribonuclease V subunit gamma [Alphaproteobacteria bacterium]
MSGGALHVHRSNRVERLVDVVEALWAQPVPGVDPALEPEHVVVPSRGMARWLQLELAARRGVVANVRWWLPRELVDAVLRPAAPASASATPSPVDAWQRERLAWSLLALLPEVIDAPGFEPVRHWLGEARHDVARQWELARRLAEVFDRYAVHRDDRVLAWAQGEQTPEEGWQAELWRRLEARLGRGHAAARVPSLLQEALPEGLPRRLLLFGLGTLPPLYLRVLRRLARQADVHLLVLAPSSAWIADARRRGPAGGADVHPLLRSLGRVASEFQAMLEAPDVGGDYEGSDHDAPPHGEHALAVLQRGMLEGGAPVARVALRPGDDSLQVLGCHSPAREVEVLRDRLWALFAARPDLGPRDVLVLVPDITVHGPLVDAVFGIDPDDPLHLPYTVADRPLASGNAVARCLVDLLRLVGSRLPVTAVVDLLAHAPLRERFGIAEGEVTQVEALLDLAGVRWGRDAAHRRAEGQPDVEAFTWRFGLDRLLLGHAVAAERTTGGVAPVLDVEGDAAALVGRLAELVDAVERALDEGHEARTPAGWAAWLDGLLDRLLRAHEEDDLQRVREVVLGVAEEAAEAGFEGEVPLVVLRRELEARLLEERRQGSFLRGGITVCELLPMRSVPARVVAVLGLSDGDFPRADARVDFDLIDPRRPRLGDRSRRHDDRYLVLEALLSARDVLLLSYVSHSVQDNAPLPPSVVLADLLDAVDACLEGPPDAQGQSTPAREALVVHHPLQPFSPAYVLPEGAPRLVTFDVSAAAGAAGLVAGARPPPPFFDGAPLAPAALEEVALGDLVAFLRDPVAWFHATRLGIATADELATLAEREPLELGVLDDLGAGQRLLELRLAGLDWEEAADQLRAEALLPLGQLANAWLRKASRRVRAVARAARPRLEAPTLPSAVLDVEVGGVRLVGRVDDLRAPARVAVRYQKVGPERLDRRLEVWVPHLALQLLDGPRVSELYAFDTTKGLQGGALVAFDRVDPEAARVALGDLVALYREGHARPLPFLPRLSGDLLAGVRAGESFASMRWKLSKAAEGWWEHRTASAAAWSRLLGGLDGLLVDEAVDVAARVLDPLFELGRRP